MIRPIAPAFLIALLWTGVSTASQTEPDPSTETAEAGHGEPRVKWVPGPRAIRFHVVDGLIRLAGETREVEVGLEWSLLPPDSLTGGDYQEFVLDNEALANRPPGGGADERALQRALGGDLGALDVEAWDRQFQEIWDLDNLSASPAWQAFRPLELYGLLRDHVLLRTFLQSGGMEFTIEVGDDPNPIRPGGVTWTIRQYTEKRRAGGRWDTIHRYTITARATGTRIRLPPGSQAREVRILIRARLIEGTRGPSSILEAPEFVFAPETIEIPQSTAKVERLKRSDAPSLLETAIELGTGLPTADIVLHGLRLGSRYASLAGGALVEIDRVDPAVGLNFELLRGRRASGGALIAASTSEGALYAGPSLRVGLLQLSIGGLLAEADDGKDELEGRWAGVLSLDLPRLLGLKEDLREVRLVRDAAGGSWGRAADDVMGDLRLLRLEVDADSTVPDEQIVLRLERTRTEDDREATGADRSIVRVAFDLPTGGASRTLSRFLFVPGGRYCVQIERPDGLVFTDSGGTRICPAAIDDPDNTNARRARVRGG